MTGIKTSERIPIESLPDADLVKEFVEKAASHSKRSRDSAILVTRDFYKRVGKHIVDVTYDDMDNYLKGMDARKLCIGTKNRYRSQLRTYLTFARAKLKRQGYKLDEDLMPPKELFEFTNTQTTRTRVEVYTDEEMDEMLEKIKSVSYRDYAISYMAKSTGDRVSEILSIKREKFFLDQRRYRTGLEDGAGKTSRRKHIEVEYCFSKKCQRILANYLQEIPEDSIWLFPSDSSESGFLSASETLEAKYRNKFGLKLYFHAFRRTLITRRLMMMNDAVKSLDEAKKLDFISKLLVNQAAGDVQLANYLKLKPEERLAIFDKWNPYHD